MDTAPGGFTPPEEGGQTGSIRASGSSPTTLHFLPMDKVGDRTASTRGPCTHQTPSRWAKGKLPSLKPPTTSSPRQTRFNSLPCHWIQYLGIHLNTPITPGLPLPKALMGHFLVSDPILGAGSQQGRDKVSDNKQCTNERRGGLPAGPGLIHIPRAKTSLHPNEQVSSLWGI